MKYGSRRILSSVSGPQCTTVAGCFGWLQRPRLMHSPQQTIETALEQDVTTEGEIAPRGQFDELKKSAVESRHRAVGHDEVEIRLEEIEEIEGAESETSRCDPHEQECQPCGPMKEPVEQSQKRHRSTQFLALVDPHLVPSPATAPPLPASNGKNLKIASSNSIIGNRRQRSPHENLGMANKISKRQRPAEG
jgi:hypothetical protein